MTPASDLWFDDEPECPACRGRGLAGEPLAPCAECDGSGRGGHRPIPLTAQDKALAMALRTAIDLELHKPGRTASVMRAFEQLSGIEPA